MQAVLIFAGQSCRFRPLREKSFFPVAGTTLVEEQVRRLKQAGLNDILLVAGAHNRNEAAARFPTLKMVQQEDLTLGMRGALLSALPHCNNEPVMVVSGNDLIDSSAYETLLMMTRKMKTGGAILARKVKEYFPGGYLTVKQNRITGIVEKPAPGTEPSDLVNIVAHIHVSASSLLKALNEVKPAKDDGYELALDALMQREKYVAVPYAGSWQPVKYPWHLLSVLPLLLPTNRKPIIHGTASVHPTAVIEGAVIIGPHVRVFAHATVMGPCTIGEGTIVANNALVRGSSVGKNCVIGYSTEIARSVLGDDVWTHSSYVGDSVFGNNISLGAGTVTGNLRLDEGEISSVIDGVQLPTGLTKFGAIVGDDCRLGIHTSLLPGIKIGAGSFISSAVVIGTDVPDASFVKNGDTAGSLIIRKNTKSAPAPAERTKFKRGLGK
ncbi:MAG: NTP transferase domain-containing protein [Candidatus Peribacteraceae bacterium]|nr:NTP transferase domain-containing protein [Candidatus Peribacteraceae bacterium]